MKYKGLELVVERHKFYHDKYRLSLITLGLMVAINLLLLFTIFYRSIHPLPPRYFAATPDGRIINIHPLNDPVVTDDFVLQWSSNVARQAFNLDFINWKEQLQLISKNFTPSGWNWFIQQLKSSNNLNTLTDLKMVSNAKITGAPQLLRKAVVAGHYAWEIKLPLLVTYQSNRKVITQPLMLTMVVLRMPVKDYPQRIAINNFIADTGAKVS